MLFVVMLNIVKISKLHAKARHEEAEKSKKRGRERVSTKKKSEGNKSKA